MNSIFSLRVDFQGFVGFSTPVMGDLKAPRAPVGNGKHYTKHQKDPETTCPRTVSPQQTVQTQQEQRQAWRA